MIIYLALPFKGLRDLVRVPFIDTATAVVQYLFSEILRVFNHRSKLLFSITRSRFARKLSKLLINGFPNFNLVKSACYTIPRSTSTYL